MLRASIGGRDAARWRVYRHALVRLMMPLLSPLRAGRGWSDLSLALAASLMSWQAAPTLLRRFGATLTTLDAALPRRRRTGRTYQGFIKALTRRGAGVVTQLAPHLRSVCRSRAGVQWRIGRFVPIGADGSKFNAPRTIGNEPLGFAGKDKCGPQIMTLLLMHLGTMIPWAWKNAGVRHNERTLLREVLDVLPEDTILVVDAGFTGFDLLWELRRRGVHFLVRVGSGVRLLTELGYYRREGKHTVYLWPDAERKRPPLVLRLINVGEVYLITDVTDPRELSKRAAGELYRRRWGLEVAFRTLKRTLEHHTVRSGTAAHALAELDWTITGLQILALMGARAIGVRKHEPRRLSIARALAAIRAAQHAGSSGRGLSAALGRSLQDSYKRHGSKKSRRWPRKKAPPSIGPPILIVATSAQVQEAASLRRQKHAA